MHFLVRIFYSSSCLKLLITSMCVTFLAHRTLTVPSTMKAAVLNTFGPPTIFQVENVAVPKISRNQVLIKVEAAGINPVDAYIRSGSYHAKPPLPAILGKEIAGYVEEIDPLIMLYQAGDRVFCLIDSGGYAEYAAANVTSCYPLSERLSFSQGAALFISYFTAFRALILRGHVQRNDTVLIHGASSIMGTAAIQVAKHAGAYVTATVSDSDFERLAKESGAHTVVYHNTPNYLQNLLDYTKKPGFDAILEILAELDIERDKQFLTPYGRIVVVGNRVNIDEAGRGVVYTVSLFRFTKREQSLGSAFILDAINKSNINPLVDREFLLEDVCEAHKEITNLISPRGKFVIVFK